jgi:hypothetical protein
MPTEHLTQKEIYSMIRAQIEHENQLLDNRVNWLLLSQGFLFVSFTTILTLVADKKLPVYLLNAVAIIGITLNVFGFIGLTASMLYIGDLVKFWNRSHHLKVNNAKGVQDEFPPIVGLPKFFIINGGLGSTLTPIVFGTAWVLLMIFVRF